MVAFGKKLKERQIPEWRGYYINYKLMKKKVKQYAQQIQEGVQDRRHVLKEFSRMLDNQIEKTVLFLLEQQGLLASRIEKLGERHALLQQHPVISQISELREEYRAVGQDLLRLLFFVEINAIGLRKILKKFDKRFGYRFTDYYVTTRANHPYSQLQQVFKHVGIGAVVGALSRNLADLQDRQGSYWSIYDQPSITLQDPVIDSIKAAVDRLTHSTNFLHFLGQHALIMQEELPSPAEDPIDEQKYHFMSLALNLVNTFLYMVNTYIIVPTADNYALSLGAAATVCGVIIGSMAVAQVFSSVYFSAWSNKSYFRPLIFSSVVLFVGNVLYALAYDLDSIAVLLIGRLFCGLGSARAVNRRYISDCVPLNIRMQASAAFVTAGALGMAIGPALASFLQTNFKIFIITINADTLPGWVMAVAWLIYLIWLLISFKEPVRDTEDNHQPQEANSGPVQSEELEKGLAQPLLLSSEEKETDEDESQECDGSEESSEHSHKPANSIASAYRLLTPSVKVQLLIYFMLKYAMEILLSESSVITTYYFSWSTTTVAIFLGCLGITVLPVNIVVGSYITNLFEDRQILLASEIMVLIGILFSFHVISPYTVPQYVCSALITFVSAQVLEGVNLSLLSRVMSSRLARGTYNGGLLSTEAGTLARVVADGTITLAGYLGEDKLLNVTLLPSLLICIGSIAATFLTYNSLF
ncbi:SPX domain-containing membrane protein At4g22990-like [Magnolia sinica]|uniref:SPX domain-containing membrane protein At4g22990-like n=1 Tax=Magnolia sinica TaxID=86752 RepID=UPI00265B1EAA|nr:SPX domain-containing membrane protein At4g22990-like [Magnolia sinica]XP_058104730.1 SPX domain-containing membrane protein At4g22990-like [Magnolia sinica]